MRIASKTTCASYLFGDWKIWKTYHNCNRKANKLFDKYCDHFHISPHQFQGVELDEFAQLETFYETQLFAVF